MWYFLAYLLIGFLWLLTPANRRDLALYSAELQQTFHPTRPVWLVGIALGLIFMVLWPLNFRFTITRK